MKVPTTLNRIVWRRLAALAWALAAAAGFASLTVYGTQGQLPARPPVAAEAKMPVAPVGFTLVMAVHPQCPCTRASLYDLERLIARCGEALRVKFIMYVPRGQDWSDSALWKQVAGLPGAEVIWDVDGKLGASVGATTSGSVVLYAASGEPRFWGGITNGRGMSGESAGADAIAAIVKGGLDIATPTAVYGCPLCEPREACNMSDRGTVNK